GSRDLSLKAANIIDLMIHQLLHRTHPHRSLRALKKKGAGDQADHPAPSTRGTGTPARQEMAVTTSLRSQRNIRGNYPQAGSTTPRSKFALIPSSVAGIRLSDRLELPDLVSSPQGFSMGWQAGIWAITLWTAGRIPSLVSFGSNSIEAS